MKQEIQWKKIPKNPHRLDKDIYLFKSKYTSLAPSIVSGRLWFQSLDTDFEYMVYIVFDRVEIKMPIYYFSHYAEI